MKRLLILLSLLCLSCTTVVRPPHRPTAPCSIPTVPPYPDTKEALSEAPGLLGRDTLIQQGKYLRDEYEKRVTLTKKKCQR